MHETTFRSLEDAGVHGIAVLDWTASFGVNVDPEEWAVLAEMTTA